MPVNIAAGLRSAKRGGKQAIKRKALAEINRAAKRKETDGHLWIMNPIYSRRVKRIPPIVSALT